MMRNSIQPRDSIKQQAFDADLKAIQQINFAENLASDPNTNVTIFFIIEQAKVTILDFSQGNVRVLLMSPYDLVTACPTIYFDLI